MTGRTATVTSEGVVYEQQRAARIAQNHARMQVRTPNRHSNVNLDITHLLVCRGALAGARGRVLRF